MRRLFSKKSINVPITLCTSIFFLFLLYFVISWLHFLYSPLLTSPPVGNEEKLIVEFKPGMTLKQLAYELKQQGVLKNPRYFIEYARLKEETRRVQAGEYAFSYQAKPEEILKQLVKGEVLQYYLTVVEGWTMSDLLSALKANVHLQETLDTKDMVSLKIDSALIGNKSDYLEGCFYPDTYAFPQGTTDRAFLARAYQRMQQALLTAWAARDNGLPYKSPYEALIAASLIEKETALPAERPLVSSVILNRLRLKMPLQIDAAVLYGLYQKDHQRQHTLTRADLQRDTPYNTYRHYGIPPTPIALPSLQSIQAVLHPAVTDYLYYVAKGDGTHYFSKALKEHNAAVLKYQIKSIKSQTKNMSGKDPIALQETAHAQ